MFPKKIVLMLRLTTSPLNPHPTSGNAVLWRKMGKPGRRLEIEPKPLTRDEEDEVFCQQLWDKYCEYRTEEV